MTTISAEMILDSCSPEGVRLSTLKLRYPRFIHSEFMTHRTMSRNASSSRAIPVSRLIEDVERDPAVPLHWGKNQPGMQAREEHDALVDVGTDLGQPIMVGPEATWELSMRQAIQSARAFSEAGYHKQIANRLLEPFSHINVVVSATEWDNFFTLRDHEDAEPHIRMLAQAIRKAMDESEPKEVPPGWWHLPFVKPQDHIDVVEYLDSPTEEQVIRTLARISVARCARVSYLTHEGKATAVREDIELALSLEMNGHWSPFEHQATPMPGSHANFVGWKQNRHFIWE